MKPVIACGDNLPELQRMPSRSADLVYVDPPFATGSDWGDYEDRYSPDELVGFLKPRMEQARRILKDDGSIYVHSDWRASPKVRLMLDDVFGEKGFRNEIIWRQGLGGKGGKKQFRRKHDTIFYYSKSPDRWTFNPIRGEVTDAMMQKYRHEDGNGKYMISYGKKWYLKGGKLLDDVWDDIPALSPTSKERTGYATQKPERLLERIISASSNPGDTVLDFFAGSGTTCAVAGKLGRRSICIDRNSKSCKLMEERLQ